MFRVIVIDLLILLFFLAIIALSIAGIRTALLKYFKTSYNRIRGSRNARKAWDRVGEVCSICGRPARSNVDLFYKGLWTCVKCFEHITRGG